MIFTSSLARIEKIFHEKYELSSTIRHKGERGRQRENGLLLFLKENLPAAYGVATGEIFPFKGADVSPQCDIIIYDQLRMPILGRTEAVQQVPLEAVYAVIECKSVIDISALKDAQDKFAKIRALPRCPSKTRIRKGMHRTPFFRLFGYRRKSSHKSCLKFMRDSSVNDDVGVFSLDTGAGVWVEGRDRPLWIDFTDSDRNTYETLAIFYVSLLESLREIDLGNPDFMRMLYLGTYES